MLGTNLIEIHKKLEIPMGPMSKILSKILKILRIPLKPKIKYYVSLIVLLKYSEWIGNPLSEDQLLIDENGVLWKVIARNPNTPSYIIEIIELADNPVEIPKQLSQTIPIEKQIHSL